MEVLQFIISLISQFIEFLDNLYIYGNLSFLKIFIIFTLFGIALNFLNKK